MGRRKKTNVGGLIVTVFTIGIVIYCLPYILLAIFIFAVGCIIYLILKFVNNQKLKAMRLARDRAMQIADIDSMTGIEFEYYLQALLTSRGYSVIVTPGSNDLGVDLVASGNDEKIAVQAKRSNSQISRRAISDAVTGMHPYHCNKAMVITNNYFTKRAYELASSTGCILIDRDTLAHWIIEFQK